MMKITIRLDNVNPDGEELQLGVDEALLEMKKRCQLGQITQKEYKAWLKHLKESFDYVANVWTSLGNEESLQ